MPYGVWELINNSVSGARTGFHVFQGSLRVGGLFLGGGFAVLTFHTRFNYLGQLAHHLPL